MDFEKLLLKCLFYWNIQGYTRKCDIYLSNKPQKMERNTDSDPSLYLVFGKKVTCTHHETEFPHRLQLIACVAYIG